jgi:hypothetical protein
VQTVGVCVPNRNLGDFTYFNVDPERRRCPSARCTSAANAISRDTGIFSRKSALLRDLLNPLC